MTTQNWQDKLREMGFGNQCVIVGAKRVELFDVIADLIDKAEMEAGKDELTQTISELTQVKNTGLPLDIDKYIQFLVKKIDRYLPVTSSTTAGEGEGV